MEQLATLQFLTALRPKNDGDFADRMIYYTITILTLFALLIFGWSFFGTPIQCWFPKQFSDFWIEYALDYCYVQNKYFESLSDVDPYVGSDHQAPNQIDHWMTPNNFREQNNIFKRNVEMQNKKSVVTYYQWVPFVMVLMAMCFHFPTVLWRFIYESTSNAGTIFNRLQAANVSFEPKERKKCSKLMAFFMHAKNACFIDDQKMIRITRVRCILLTFVSIKAICLLICLAQFFWLEFFLGLQNSWWGLTVFYDLYKNRGWNETGHFPRVTFCDFQIRELHNIQAHTVQCTLLINMFNEKFFVFLWFWLAIVTLVTTASFAYWTVFAFFNPFLRQKYVSMLEKIDPSTSERDSKNYTLVKKFVKNSFDSDCLFFLRMIELNDGDVLCKEVIEQMWVQYQKWDTKSVDADYKPSEKNLEFEPVDYPTLPSRARLSQAKRIS